MPWLILGIVILLTAGCAVKLSNPLSSTTDYWTDDPQLYNALIEAAKAWTEAGVAGASIITVELISKRSNENWKKKGRTPVIRKERENLYKMCKPDDPNYRGDGCTAIIDDKWSGIYIPYDLKDPARVKQVMLHELGHILAQTKEHAPDDARAVMHPNSTSSRPTESDVAFMKIHTVVLDPKDLV